MVVENPQLPTEAYTQPPSTSTGIKENDPTEDIYQEIVGDLDDKWYERDAPANMDEVLDFGSPPPPQTLARNESKSLPSTEQQPLAVDNHSGAQGSIPVHPLPSFQQWLGEHANESSSAPATRPSRSFSRPQQPSQPPREPNLKSQPRHQFKRGSIVDSNQPVSIDHRSRSITRTSPPSSSSRGEGSGSRPLSIHAPRYSPSKHPLEGVDRYHGRPTREPTLLPISVTDSASHRSSSFDENSNLDYKRSNYYDRGNNEHSYDSNASQYNDRHYANDMPPPRTNYGYPPPRDMSAARRSVSAVRSADAYGPRMAYGEYASFEQDPYAFRPRMMSPMTPMISLAPSAINPHQRHPYEDFSYYGMQRQPSRYESFQGQQQRIIRPTTHTNEHPSYHYENTRRDSSIDARGEIQTLQKRRHESTSTPSLSSSAHSSSGGRYHHTSQQLQQQQQQQRYGRDDEHDYECWHCGKRASERPRMGMTRARSSSVRSHSTDSHAVKRARVMYPRVLDDVKDPRFFVLKSFNLDNIKISQEKGIWATSAVAATKISEAFQTGSRIFLIFSANMSGGFQGVAEMISDIGAVEFTGWVGVNTDQIGNTFQVKWVLKKMLPMFKVENLVNPLDDWASVKKSRNAQELPESIGIEMLNAFENLEGGEGEDLRITINNAPRQHSGGHYRSSSSSTSFQRDHSRAPSEYRRETNNKFRERSLSSASEDYEIQHVETGWEDGQIAAVDQVEEEQQPKIAPLETSKLRNLTSAMETD